MNGFIRKSAALWGLVACVPFLGGCFCYRQIVDPCWPERYNAEARHSVNGHFDAQASNGHVLDQTMFNYYFEPKLEEDSLTHMYIMTPTAKLSYAGREHLKYLARRLPASDGQLYLQSANDFLPGTPVKAIPDLRSKLNAERIQSIHEYLAAITAGHERGAVAWNVKIIDLAAPDQPALPYSGALRPQPYGVLPDRYDQYKGSIPLNPTLNGGTP